MRALLIILSTILLSACTINRLAPIEVNGKEGCINKKGEIVIEPEWDWIMLGDKKKYNLVLKDSLYGYVNSKGKIIIEPMYLDAMTFDEGLAPVSNGEKFGFINTKGDTVIPFIYDDVFMGFCNGLSDFKICDSCGYIDKKGNIVIQPTYRACYPFLSNLACVEDFNFNTILVNKKGEVIQYEYEKHKKTRLWSLNTYPGSIKTETGRGRINYKGDTIVPPIYLITGNLSDNMYIVKDKQQLWGAYNKKGKLSVYPQFDYIWHFSEGLANFKINDKWGFVNKKGIIKIDPIYDYAAGFQYGLAYVEIDGKAGFINKKGELIIEAIYDCNRGAYFE